MSKRVLFVGDIHGRADWRELTLLALKNFDEIVLLGDYVDSFTARPVVQLENLKSIVSFLKNKAKGRVTALLGNHDYAYLKGKFGISGFQPAMYPDFKKIFEDNYDLFKIAWGYTGNDGRYTLVTHAGLTYTFWKKYILKEIEEGGFVHQVTDGKIPENIHETLNLLKDKTELMWKVGSMRGGAGTPGPLWADIHELLDDPYPEINQIVGHTANYSPTINFQKNGYFISRIDSFDRMKTASVIFSL